MTSVEDKPYWVAFNHINGIGAVRTGQLLQRFGTLESAWDASKTDLQFAGISEKLADQIIAFRSRTDPAALMESILARKIHITIRTESKYPRLLKEIDNPPTVLYHVGNLPPNDMPLIAIVGTRKMTSYGRNVAEDLGRFLAENGIGVVSGLARGIDGAAQSAVVNAGGSTYAVLGCGVDHIYPPEHRNLAKMIVRSGAVISEYAPGTHPDRSNFPQRNRIISGMSSGAVIVEAGEKSGSLITARFAAEQGREVFVVPGNVTAIQSRGANRLIRDGARPFYEKGDLLEFLGTWQAKEPQKMNKPLQQAFSTPEEKIILTLITDEPLHIDEIVRKSGMPLSKVSSSIVLLELKGLVLETAPQTYQKTQALF